MELIWLMFPMPNDASTQEAANSTASTRPSCLQPFAPQPVGEVVHRATLPRALLILVPVKDAQHVFGKAGHHAEKAMTHIQNTAPGPPLRMAVATPTMLPVPMVDASAVHRLWNWLIA